MGCRAFCRVALFSATLVLGQGQPIFAVNCGGGDAAPLTADQKFTGGTAFLDATLSADPEYQTLRFGTSFRYDFPVAPGLYYTELRFIEPNKTAVKQRIFRITVAGQDSPGIDLFALAGRAPYTMKTLALVTMGTLTVQFTGAVGNAVVSAIIVSQATLQDIFPYTSDGGLLSWLTGNFQGTTRGLVYDWRTCVNPAACGTADRILVDDWNGNRVAYVVAPGDQIPYQPGNWTPKVLPQPPPK